MKHKTLNVKKVREMNACLEALEWGEKVWDGEEVDSIKVLKQLIEEKHFDWANWLIVRVMTRPQYLNYAIYSAEQVIGIFEKKHPDDRPRKAIEAAKKVLKDDTEENREATYATYATYAAAYAADAAAYAADAAAYAAYAAYTAYAARAAEKEKMQLKILNYGIDLLGKSK